VRAAQTRILGHFEAVETEILPLARCAGRVLARDIRSTDLPPFDNSSVDGFALIAADTADTAGTRHRMLRVVADIPAGSWPKVRLRPGQAARIMTGAPLPPGADAVVMLENTDVLSRQAEPRPPAWVSALKSVKEGENIRRRGTDVRRGRRILERGRRLRPQDLGFLAMINAAQVRVFRKPRIALLSSGDELARPGRPSKPGQIRESNSVTLSALMMEAGCEVLGLGIARDSAGAIRALLDRAVAKSADLIVSSAGVSVGALDLVRNVVESGGKLDFWRVNVRPGKPLAFGEYCGVPFLGLPGNPVSAFVGFELFVRPAVARLAGLSASRPRLVDATLEEAVKSDGRESYLRSVVQECQAGFCAKLAGHQGSGNLLSLVQANALLIIPAGVKSLAVGDQVKAWLL
jgi:molybdopterin molybdotransferase